MKTDWSPVETELERWRNQGLKLSFWWRDDDAVKPTTALDRLSDLSERLHVPVHLAVIPNHATSALASLCSDALHLHPLVHGWAHANHAPEGSKKAEFGHARPDILTDARAGLDRLQGLFGPSLVPVFVPPWNRVTDELIPDLAGASFKGISTFTPRDKRTPAPGLVQINTHIDPIDWRGGGGVVDKNQLVEHIVRLLKDRRMGQTDNGEPLGVLTHHLVHDEAIWAYVTECLRVLLDGGARPVEIADFLIM
ncbi:MAG: polysaccharide deacetylase family protein [Sulfitobacter sp.]